MFKVFLPIDKKIKVIITRSRNGWSDAFKKKIKGKKEKVIGEEISNQFDREEWEW